MNKTSTGKTEAAPRAKKIKAQEQPPVFPDEYWIFAADFSLRRPGFCKLHIVKTESGLQITDVQTASVDNKKDKLKCRGQVLDEILFGMGAFCPHNDPEPWKLPPVYFVREKAINSRGAMSEIGLFEVVGISDFWAWQKKKSTWHEIYPVTVKRLVTGDSKADKVKVAECVKLYTGDHVFENDDESDAAAVAIAWLIQNNQIQNKLAKERAE